MAEDNIYVDPKTGVRYRLGGNDGEPMVRLDPTFPEIDLKEVGEKVDAWVEDAIDSVAGAAKAAADKFKPEVK